MQVQNRSCRNGCPRFGLSAVEGRSDEHPDAHHSLWVWNLDADLRSTDIGIQNWQDVIDLSLQDPLGIGVQVDVREVPDTRGVEIILVNVTDDPDIRKIRN